ncbi:MAG: hypothetical protein R3Y43_07490 [Alphaproteobacteria bacterium]
MKSKKYFKYKNIHANPKADFEMIYKQTTRLIAHLQNNVQQLAASYKHCEDNKNSAVVDTLPRFPNINVKLSNEDGNAFAIIGQCLKAMKKAGIDPSIQDLFNAEATSSDYSHLLTTCHKWFNVE